MKKCKWCNGLGKKIVNIASIPFAGIKGWSFHERCEKCHGRGHK